MCQNGKAKKGNLIVDNWIKLTKVNWTGHIENGES